MNLDIYWSVAYGVVFAGLSAFGIHRYYLLYLYFRHRRNSQKPSGSFSELPVVTVQLPFFNERNVAKRLLEAVGRTEYPRERIQIQILDDSTDETRDICAEEALRLAEKGFDVSVLRRPRRTGFKAGALAQGLKKARGEFILIYDADFVPAPGMLAELIHHFTDPKVGMVQARWGHLNREYSMLTKVQAIVLNGHFLVEQVARSRSGRFFNFNGTAGIWRRSCIEDAGGWQHDTLTEDLDLSYRAQLRGWKFVYRSDAVAPAELPATMTAYKSQQHRWAKGGTQTLIKMLPRIWKSQLPFRTKLEATAHLSGNLAYLLVGLLCILLFPRDSLPIWNWEWTGVLHLATFVLAFVSVGVFYLCALWIEGRGKTWREVADLPVVLTVGIGMSVNGVRAVMGALLKRESPFVRTPKHRIEGRLGRIPQSETVRSTTWVTFVQPSVELGLACYFGFLVLHASRMGSWGSVPFLLLFLGGFAYVSLASLREAVPKRDTETLRDTEEQALAA